ncbi:MAG: F0F1 ATP synthase subunit delta, partial [Minisyncoccia bacterium]
KHLVRAAQISSTANTLVISAKHELSKTDIDEIISLVGADKNVATEIISDESIVGGFSATYQGNIYDGSLRNQITQLRTRLTH